MDIVATIDKYWDSTRGLALRVKRGTTMRELYVHRATKWDVWGYAPRGARLMLRGDARPEQGLFTFTMIKEGNRHVVNEQGETPSIAEYLRDFDIVSINGVKQ